MERTDRESVRTRGKREKAEGAYGANRWKY